MVSLKHKEHTKILKYGQYGEKQRQANKRACKIGRKELQLQKSITGTG